MLFLPAADLDPAKFDHPEVYCPDRESNTHIAFRGPAPRHPPHLRDRYGIPILMSYGATKFGGPMAMMTPQFQEEFGGRNVGSVGVRLGASMPHRATNARPVRKGCCKWSARE